MNTCKRGTLSLLIILVLIGSLSAQTKELFIEYSLIDPSMSGCNRLELLCKDNVCLSSVSRTLIHTPGITRNRETDEITQLEGVSEERTSYYHVFKDASKNLLIACNEFDINDITKEKMDLFTWQLTDEKETILGYECQQAKTHFRGRDYTLWFTTQLPFKAAPWKFHGLPGVVLKAESDDEFFKCEAISLKLRKPKKEITCPYNIEEAISWEEYKNRYIANYKKNKAKIEAMMAKHGTPAGSVVIGNSKKEILVERNKYTLDQMMEKQQNEK